MNWFFGLAAGEFSVLFFGLLVKGVLADAYGIGTAPKISVHPGGEKDDPGATARERAYIAYPVMAGCSLIFGICAWAAFAL